MLGQVRPDAGNAENPRRPMLFFMAERFPVTGILNQEFDVGVEF